MELCGPLEDLEKGIFFDFGDYERLYQPDSP
jgi:hypothetical protein